MALNSRLTNRTAFSLLFCLLVVEGLIPFFLSLPGILQDGAEDGFEQQDAQVDDQKGIHRPDTGIYVHVTLSIALKSELYILWQTTK